MAYTLSGLPVAPFAHLFGKSDDDLRAAGAVRMVADAPHGFPCRVTLEDAAPGESLLLVNFTHLDAPTPYRAAHAIFVREDATREAARLDRVPDMLRSRLLSVRAYDAADMMVEADVIDGAELDALLERWFAAPAVAYVHVHTAKRGCYLARADRVPA